MGCSDPRGQRYHGLEKLVFAGSLMATLAWVLARRPFRVVVDGRSMAPTLEPGDLLIATKRGGVRRGSLVVVAHPGRKGYEMVKRVAAVAGDRIGDRTLGPGEYWVVGDDPSASTDSRSLGPVGGEAIRGVVRARYWPLSRSTVFG